MKTKFSIVLLLLIIGLNCYSVAEPTEPGVNGLGYSPLQAFASDRTEEDINLFNGNIIIRHTDVSAPGVGIPLIITRTYNSNLRYQNCEWSFSVNGINRIETDYPSASNKAIVIYGDGSRQTYFMTGHPSDEGIPLEPGVRDKLIYEDTTNTWVLAKPNGTKITFNFHGLPIKILDKNDNNIRLIRSPLPPFQIVSVFDSAGRYDYTFEYFDADKGLISRIKYKNHEEVEISFSYEYDDNSLLTKVVNPNGRETKYSYELYDTDIYNDFQWKLTEITYSSGAIVKYDYLSFDTIENEEKLNGSICTSEFLQGLQLTKTLKSAENSDEVSTYRFDLVKNTYDEGEACADPYWGRIYLHYTLVTDPNGYLSKFWFEKFYINNTEAAGEFIYTFKMVRSEQPGVVTVNDWVIDGPPHQDWVDKEKLHLEQATRTRKSPEDDQEIDYLESYEYDAYGNITLYTNPLSYIYTYTYLNIDEFNSETPTGLYIIGLQTRQSETLNGNNIEINTEYYDEGNIRGNIERRYLAQISDTRFSYNSKGLVTEKFELNEDLVHSLSYSAEGNLTEVRRNGELFNKYEYYPNGLIKLEFDNLGNYSEFNYDNLGRVLNETRPDKTNISYTLDDINNIVTVDDAGRVTTY
ncbi:hypothetical protein KAR04_08950, partial [Candidatus Calescamantes bacterium]|nr:hypothetical protein [Candidatus Calescamantes bacterium]